MCGRFAQSQPLIHYAHALDPNWNPEQDKRPPTWNLAPEQFSWAFVSGGEEILTTVLKWGLLPSWADKDDTRPINAKAETAATKPYFRKAWKSGRCLIPADGWYEWTEVPKVGKQPWFLHRADNDPVLFAGLWEHNSHSGNSTFVILTMATDGKMKEVHDRKPVVLERKEARHWIEPTLSLDEIQRVASSALKDNQFEWYRVSTQVNSPRNDGPDLLNPV
ncbi:MAG: SOS response-associated peptidase [Pseudomonadota bacterium]|nr:SOS response-associated peptidase [Pseudomonadota bacterium]